jgi:hypothetical protein
LGGCYLVLQIHTPDPQEAFVIAVAMWLVSKRSGRTMSRLIENYSANAAISPAG